MIPFYNGKDTPLSIDPQRMPNAKGHPKWDGLTDLIIPSDTNNLSPAQKRSRRFVTWNPCSSWHPVLLNKKKPATEVASFSFNTRR